MVPRTQGSSSPMLGTGEAHGKSLRDLKNFFGVWGLCCIAWALPCCGLAFSSCGAQASHCGDFSCCGARDLGCLGSVVSAHTA